MMIKYWIGWIVECITSSLPSSTDTVWDHKPYKVYTVYRLLPHQEDELIEKKRIKLSSVTNIRIPYVHNTINNSYKTNKKSG